MIRRLSVLALALALGGAAQEPPAPAGGAAQLTAQPGSPGRAIPAGFLGFAWNKGQGGFTSGYFTPADAGLIAIMRRLGPAGTFRIGGTPCASSEGAATPRASLQALRDFLAAVGPGWTRNVIWCLNMAHPTMGANDIAYAKAEVGDIESLFGAGVVTYAIGNEPDLYYRDEAAFQSQWRSFHAAIRAAYPKAKFSGPEIASPLHSGAGWIGRFVAGVGAANLAFATAHYYTTGPSAWTPGNLLALEARQLDAASSRSFVARDAAAAAPVPLRMDEANTLVYDGGVRGVSDAAVSAAWVVNSAIGLARAGWLGLDLATVCYPGKNVYTPINAKLCDGLDWYVNPEFAGMRLVAEIANSRVIPVSMQPRAANLNVLGLLTPAGGVAFLIANLDAERPVAIAPQAPTRWSKATATIVGGVSPAAAAARINGVAMSARAGACSSACPPSTHDKGAAIVIPAGGAAYVTLQ